MPDDPQKITEEATQVISLVTEVVTNLGPDIVKLGEAAKPVVGAYMKLLLKDESFEGLMERGERLQLALAFIEAGIKDPVTVAQCAKTCQDKLSE
jgi:hypothetical protein